MAWDSQLLAVPNKVAAVCYREIPGTTEFLLVKTSSGRWTFPKGNIEPNLTLHESAELEAYEEAGAMGRISKEHFDRYVHAKQGGRSDPSVVAAFLLEVEQTIPPMETHREPAWFSAREAKLKLSQGRDRRFRVEFCRVIDKALLTIHTARASRSSPPLRSHFTASSSRFADSR